MGQFSIGADRNDVGYLLRTLDVRLVALPPNPALAAVRAYGSPALRQKLKKQTENVDTAIEGFSRSRLFKSLLEEFGRTPLPYSDGRPPSTDTEDEYIRIQRTAASDDKPLNRALSYVIDESLKREGVIARIEFEKRNLPGTNLQPDIQIWLNDSEVICLEPTWRSSGREVKGEIAGGQNSMTPGNIQKYLLTKVFDYVAALGL